MSIRQDVKALIDGILQGDILGTFDLWYADDTVMSENGADERVGRAANRAYDRHASACGVGRRGLWPSPALGGAESNLGLLRRAGRDVVASGARRRAWETGERLENRDDPSHAVGDLNRDRFGRVHARRGPRSGVLMPTEASEAQAEQQRRRQQDHPHRPARHRRRATGIDGPRGACVVLGSVRACDQCCQRGRLGQ